MRTPFLSGDDDPFDATASGRTRRDSLFGEPIRREFRPKPVPPPLLGRLLAALLALSALVTTCFAIVVARVIRVEIGGMLALSCWLAILATVAYFGPPWWRRATVVSVTNKHVLVRRGRLRRSIDLSQISFARIHWHRSVAGVGDLELIRAVPTGAFRRTLTITLPDLHAPDAVWALIRGVAVTRVLGDGARPVGQRLDSGERVLWTAKPFSSSWDVRRTGNLLVAVLAGLAGVRAVLGGLHSVHSILEGGLAPVSASFGALALGLGISVAAVVLTALLAAYYALWRPSRMNQATRYVVTDKRVLIQCGSEELHLDRDRIVDVIDTPKNDGSHDLFLVVGGKYASAHALAGAFGERVNHGVRGELMPVLRAVQDSDTVRAILEEEPREAA